MEKTGQGGAKTHVRDFTSGNITSQLVLFALPLFLSNLLQVFYNMVDMIVVGHVLGKVGTSAVSVGGDISALMTFIAMGFSAAGQVIIAKYIGSRQQDKIGKFVGTMGSFLVVCAIVVSILGLVFQDALLSLMNTPSDAYAGAKGYSTVCMLGLVFIYGYNIVSAVLRGMGDSKHPFIFIAIAAIINVILDILLVALLGMGAAGAALATVISQAISFLSCTFFLAKRRKEFGLDIHVKDFLSWNRPMLSDLVKLGVPMAIKTASIQVSKLFVNSWVNSYGTDVSAFAGIANKISSISNLVSAAMNTAGSTMVGQNIAAEMYGRVNKILIRIAVITLTMSSLMSLFVLIFPDLLFGMFTSDTEVLRYAKAFIPIAILLFFGSSLRAIMNALINGSGNYRINFATAILDGIVMRIGLALLFGVAFKMKHYGFWFGDALAGFTPFWIGLVFYISGRWRSNNNKKDTV
ncbi:MAG: MATE family efflux transporter [Clostridia bacterium]|nr:MATE family efflux transporter [Clostridia bacterium]